MKKSSHNIICIEGEWEYREDKTKFNLNTEPLLNWLKAFHGCDVVYRHIFVKSQSGVKSTFCAINIAANVLLS